MSLEQQIYERRVNLSGAGIAIAELKESEDEKKLDVAKLRFNEAKQNYLNALDRLCFCIIKKLLEDDDMRPEYREIISRAISDFSADFQTGSPYRNIKKVYEKWADT